MTLARRSSPAADGGVARSAWLLVGAILLLTVLLTALAVGLLYEYQRQRLRNEAATQASWMRNRRRPSSNAARFQVQATKREFLLRAGARHWLERPDELQALLTEIERVSPRHPCSRPRNGTSPAVQRHEAMVELEQGRGAL